MVTPCAMEVDCELALKLGTAAVEVLKLQTPNSMELISETELRWSCDIAWHQASGAAKAVT